MDDRNFRYMFYGFAAAWLLMIGYVLVMNLRERKLRRELDRVRRMVEKGGRE
jgi:CcmD family protein